LLNKGRSFFAKRRVTAEGRTKKGKVEEGREGGRKERQGRVKQIDLVTKKN